MNTLSKVKIGTTLNPWVMDHPEANRYENLRVGSKAEQAEARALRKRMEDWASSTVLQVVAVHNEGSFVDVRWPDGKLYGAFTSFCNVVAY